MIIAVLSGKGGAGKTFVSVNLASVVGPCRYLDCDVEEPNGALFLKPVDETVETVSVMMPVVDPKRCDGCRRCVDFCKFNALASLKGELRIFPELCHGCDGCLLVCPNGALTRGSRPIGSIRRGMAGAVAVDTGVLDVGQVTGVPIVKAMVSAVSKGDTVIVDCPPGSACVVMESIREADYCVLVAEPTIFGLHNLGMIHQLVTAFQKPFGLILNKVYEGDSVVDAYCQQQRIPLLAKLPYDGDAAETLALGELLVQRRPDYRERFEAIHHRILQEVDHAAAGRSER